MKQVPHYRGKRCVSYVSYNRFETRKSFIQTISTCRVRYADLFAFNGYADYVAFGGYLRQLCERGAGL
jgi:hypothetical protein